MHKHSKIAIFSSFVVTAILAGATWAVAGTGSGSSDVKDALTAEDVYTSDMTLPEIAKAATGTPGQVAPPCPTAESVLALKKAGLEFGPCDVSPAEGDPVVVPADTAPVPAPADETRCPAVLIHSGYGVSLPCDKGARITSIRPVANQGERLCANVTYVAKTGTDAITELLCEGDVPKVGGDPVRGPLSLSDDDEDHDHNPQEPAHAH